MKLRPDFKPVKCVETGEVFENTAAAARAYGISPAVLYQYFTNEKMHSCWGFHWQHISHEEYYKVVGDN